MRTILMLALVACDPPTPEVMRERTVAAPGESTAGWSVMALPWSDRGGLALALGDGWEPFAATGPSGPSETSFATVWLRKMEVTP